MILWVLLLLVIPFVLPIVGLVSQGRLRARLHALEETLERHQRTIDELTRWLRDRPKDAAASQQPIPQPAAHAAERVVAPPPIVPPQAPPPVVRPPAPVPTPAAPPQPVVTPPPAPTVAPPRVAEPPAPVMTPPPPPPAPPPAAPIASAPEPNAPPLLPFDWEDVVGVKLFSAVAGIALVLAAIFFLRYSIEHGWLAPSVRVAISVIGATALLVVCERKAARKYPVTANALDAAAIAILFSTFFAAHALWHLIPMVVAFGLLALVTLVAVLLSIRRDSLFIAVLGLLGGFATPALLSTGENLPVPLFTYLLLLNVGLAWVAYRKSWPLLTILTLVLTTIYQWGWVIRFLTVSQLSLAMGIFLVFSVASFVALTLGRRGLRESLISGDAGAETEMDRVLEQTGMAASGMPLVFAIYLAAVPAFGAQAGLLFGFLFLIDAGLLAVALGRHEKGPACDRRRHDAARVCDLARGVVCEQCLDDRDGVCRTVHRVLRAGAARGRARRASIRDARDTCRLYRAVAAVRVPGDCAHRAGGGIAAAVRYHVPAVGAPRVAGACDSGARAVLRGRILRRRRRGGVVGDPSRGRPPRRRSRALHRIWRLLSRRTSRRAPTGTTARAALGRRGGADGQPRAAAVPRVGFARGGGALGARAVARDSRRGTVHRERVGRPADVVGRRRGAVVDRPRRLVGKCRRRGRASSIVARARRPDARDAGRPRMGPCGNATKPRRRRSNDTIRIPARHLSRTRRASLPLLRRAESGMGDSSLAGLRGPGGIDARRQCRVVVCRGGRVARGGRDRRRSDRVRVDSDLASRIVGAGGARRGRNDDRVRARLAVNRASRGPNSGVGGGRVCVVHRRADGHRRIEIGWSATARRGHARPRRQSLAHPRARVDASMAMDRAGGGRTGMARHIRVARVPSGAGRVEGRARAGGVALRGVCRVSVHSGPARMRHARPASDDSRGKRVPVLRGAERIPAGGLTSIVGIVPVAEGVVMALLLRELLSIQPAGSRNLGRLAIVAGTALAFATVAIPLQLRQQWITVGWALEGAALAWLYRRISHRGLLYSALALLSAVFVRLALNPAVFLYEPRGTRVFNWYFYAYLACGAALFVAAWWFSGTDDRVIDSGDSGNSSPRASALLPVGGVILLFLLLNIEIADFYATGPEITFRFGVTIAQDLTYTIGWLLFGLALLTAGIYLHNRPGRVAAVALIAVTTCKAFLYDMGSLGGLYRVASLAGLAVSLALVALALQKFVLQAPKEAS